MTIGNEPVEAVPVSEISVTEYYDLTNRWYCPPGAAKMPEQTGKAVLAVHNTGQPQVVHNHQKADALNTEVRCNEQCVVIRRA